MKPFLFLLLGTLPLHAAGDEKNFLGEWRTRMRDIVPRSYVCPFAASAPVIDGKLDEAAWAAAPWTADFVDIEGDAKPKPLHRTRAKMLWDDTMLYFAAEMASPHVWGTHTQHDAVIFEDPDLEVFIDPDGDSINYYEFEVNALNTGWDLFLPKPYKDGGKADNSWSIPGLKTAVHIRGTLNKANDIDEGWDVEIAIPWKVLAEHSRQAAPPAEGDQWRIGFSHVDWQVKIEDGKYVKLPNTREFNWIWSAQGIVDMHRPERWGYVQFTRKAADTVPFVPDATRPARDALQEVYYAQKDFFTRNKRWADTPVELELKLATSPVLGDVALVKTGAGFDATVELRLPGVPAQLWKISQDSMIAPVK